MKVLKISFLMIFCFLLCIKEHSLYGSDTQPNGCGPSKGYELKDDKSEPITKGSGGSSNSSSASKDSSSKSK